MAASQTDIKIQLAELSANAMEAFCCDISGMFGIELTSDLSDASTETAKGISKKYKKLAAVIAIKAKGILGGEFYIVFDKEGLFTLAGTVVMLPEQRILDSRKNGSVEDAEELHDAVGETGNLLVGSWDRIFREELEGHIHFLQTGTFIGNPWIETKKNIGVSDEEEFLFYPCEMTVGSFPIFHCGIIFPNTVFQKNTQESPAAVSQSPPDQEPIDETSAEKSKEATSQPEGSVVKEDQVEASKPEVAVAVSEVPEGPVFQETAATANTPAVADNSKTHDRGAVSQTIQKMVQSQPILPGEHSKMLSNIYARDIMKKEVLWGEPDDSVAQAMETMQQTDASCLLVGDRVTPVGIVTWIDIAEAVSIYLRPVFSKWRRPEDDATLQIKLKVIMTRPIRTIRMQTPLSAVIENMCQHCLRCLPVVDEQGQVKGVVSAFDIFKLLMQINPDLSSSEVSS